ncbi:hypothetical protein H8E07_03380 [bacterium]|nr:hypothetical protein [bacterium]
MQRDLVRLRQLFRRSRVLDMAGLQACFETRSRRSLFRDLAAVGYQTSYTHGGRYYTLSDVPEFDEWGLWFFRDIGFSEVGTLKDTVAVQVERAPDGRMHAELQHLLRVRVHNTLLELLRAGRVGRERYERACLYVGADPERAAEQLRRRQEGDRAVAEILRAPTLQEIIEILSEALRGSAEIPPPEDIAKRLAARGVEVTPQRVRQVFTSHGLVPGKKTALPT